jgi:hypothetical protein
MIRIGERLETLAQSGSIFTNGLGLLYIMSLQIFCLSLKRNLLYYFVTNILFIITRQSAVSITKLKVLKFNHLNHESRCF